MHRALTEGLVSHQGGALVVLQCASDDLAGRGRALIDQHHQRQALVDALGDIVESSERVSAAAALVELGRCFVDEFALGELPVGRHHGNVLWQKGSRQRYGCIKVATWVIAKIKHQALELRVFLVNFFCLAGKIFDGSFLKLADPNPAIARLQELTAHRLGANFVPNDGDREAAIL